MIYYVLLAVLVVLVIIAIELKDLLYSVIVLAGASSILALLFFLLQAPDIAITQFVAEAGVSTAIFVVAISRTVRREEQ
jgi:uncharacterized MnhB-related membrane protein